MKHGIFLVLALLSGLQATAASAAGGKPTEINVGYFIIFSSSLWLALRLTFSTGSSRSSTLSLLLC